MWTLNRPYKRVTWNSTNEYLKELFGNAAVSIRLRSSCCNNKHIDEYKLHEVFVKAFNNKPASSNFNDAWGKIVEKRFRKIFKKKIAEFDEELFLKVVEKIVILDDVVKVCFLDGCFVEV